MSTAPPDRPADEARARYLALLKQCLTRAAFPDGAFPGAILTPEEARRTLADPQLRDALDSGKLEVVVRKRQAPAAREEGRDWPLQAETMIGLKRLGHLEECLRDVLTRPVPGDLFEAGVWRGGATIFMAAVLKAFGDRERRVWVADSFQGPPRPDTARYPRDRELDLLAFRELSVPLTEVQENFRRYGLLDEQVRFLAGWFRDTLPGAKVQRLALLRVHGDSYESTMLALEHLYEKLSPGGHVIVDGCHLEPCRAAVEDFREKAPRAALREVDWSSVSWRKEES